MSTTIDPNAYAIIRDAMDKVERNLLDRYKDSIAAYLLVNMPKSITLAEFEAMNAYVFGQVKVAIRDTRSAGNYVTYEIVCQHKDEDYIRDTVLANLHQDNQS